jgi:hypothetical protein
VNSLQHRINIDLLEQEPYSKWKKNCNSRAKLGVDDITFDFLLNLISGDLDSFHGVKALGSDHKKLLSKSNLLALVLNWIKEYPSKRSLSVSFGVPSTTVEDYLPRLVEILHEHLQSFVSPLFVFNELSNGHL